MYRAQNFVFNKRRNRLSVLAAVLIALSSLNAIANDDPVAADAKKAGHAVGSAARDVGKGAKKVGKAIGKEAKTVGKTIGHAAKEGGKEFHRAVTGKSEN